MVSSTKALTSTTIKSVSFVQTSILLIICSSACSSYNIMCHISYNLVSASWLQVALQGCVTYRHYCFCKCCIDSLEYCKYKPRNFGCQKGEKFLFITEEINPVTWEFSLTWPLSLNTLPLISLLDSFKLYVSHMISTLVECCIAIYLHMEWTPCLYIFIKSVYSLVWVRCAAFSKDLAVPETSPLL